MRRMPTSVIKVQVIRAGGIFIERGGGRGRERRQTMIRENIFLSLIYGNTNLKCFSRWRGKERGTKPC